MSKDRVAAKLRAMGYVPIPRMWVKPEELDLIMYMAKQHEAVVTEVRIRISQEEKAWKSNRSSSRS